MKEWMKNNKKIIVFTFYAIITLILIYFHENWRDEAQAWLIARDCNFIELITEMKYEGHFLLWYLILMPFAKLGFPYCTTNIISWLITCISVWLILDKAPFKFYKRAIFIFTFPLLYLFPIISRCYCLIPLAIVLMCIFYKNRKEKPFRYLLSVVLLANTHVIMLGMVGVVLLDYIFEIYKDSKSISVKEKKKRIYYLIITIILLIITMLPLVGCLSTNQTIGTTRNYDDFISKIITAIFYWPLKLVMMLFSLISSNIVLLSFIFFMIFLLLFDEIRNYPLVYLKVFVSIMWQCLIYSFIYGTSLQRVSTIIFILFYFKWVNTYENKKKIDEMDKKISDIIFQVLVIANIVTGILYVTFYEIPCNYSNAYQIGNYINEEISDGSIILNGPRVEFTSSVIPYVKNDVKFYHITGNRYFSYAIWDTQNKLNIELDDIKNLSNIFGENQKLYYIYCKNKDSYGKEKDLIKECIEKGIFKELYSTDDASIYAENYILYEVNL